MPKKERNTKTSEEDQLLGRMLRQLREKSRITQAEMAEALCVDQSLISRQESGEFRLDYQQVFEYLDVIGYSFQKFAGKFEAELHKLRND